LRRALLALGALLLAGVLLLGTAAAWWWQRDDGWQVALQRLPGVSVTSVQGRLGGGEVVIQGLQWQDDRWQVRVDRMRWRDTRWTWRPFVGAWLGVGLEGLEVGAVHIKSPTTPSQRPPPADLRLPFALLADGLRVASVQLDTQQPITDIAGRLALAQNLGGQHGVERLQFRWRELQGSLTGTIETDAPMQVVARADLQTQAAPTKTPTTLPAWQGQLEAKGPLQRLDVVLNASTVRGSTHSGTTARVAPSLQARTVVQAFTPWPVSALEATLQGVDLHAIQSTLPSTELTGTVSASLPSDSAPLNLRLDLRNTLAGRWDAQRLPLQSLRATVEGSMAQRDTVELRAMDATLLDDAGRVTGQGRWHQGDLQAALNVAALRPAKLDPRLPAMTLGGALTWEARGLPTPSSLTEKASVPNVPVARTREHPLAVTLQTDLKGRLEGRVQAPVAIKLDGTWQRDGQRQSLAWPTLTLRAAEAQATSQGHWERRTDGTWRLRSSGEMRSLDPKVWWPQASTSSAWQQGSHLLQGSWQAEVDGSAGTQLPPVWTAAALADWAQRLRGNAQVQWAQSRLAGVPLQGHAQWSRREREAAQFALDAEAANNRVQVQGRLALQGDDDRWTVRVQGPQPAALANLAKLSSAAASWWPSQGTLDAQLDAQGRGPSLTSKGSVSAAALRAGAWQLGDMQAQWSHGPLQQSDAPLNLKLDARNVASRAQGNTYSARLNTLRASLEGTLAEHALQIDATSPVRPPAWAYALGNVDDADDPAQRGVAVQLRSKGRLPQGLVAGGAIPWQWAVERLDVRARSDAKATAWLSAKDLGLSLQLSPALALTELQATPGSAQLMGAGVRWTQARWQHEQTGKPAALDLDATLDPMRAAPWLDRLAPVIGVGGDLLLGGRFKVRTTPTRFDVDAVVERRSGDLTLTDQGATQSMGLSDLRVALSAQDGTWHFTQAVAGTNLGVLVGATTVRVNPALRWPAATTPLEGVMSWRVDNLNALSPWLPPGWRLGGAVSASLSLGGQITAPAFTGSLDGDKMAVRSLLDGVDVREGAMRVALRGDNAIIERMSLRGGDGTLSVSGGATFGATPALDVQVAADRFLAQGRVDRRLVTSGQARLRAGPQDWLLDGRVKVDEGLIDLSRRDAPSLDSDVRIVRPGDDATPTREDPSALIGTSSNSAERPRGLLRRGQLNLQVDLGEQLTLKGRGIDTRLTGALVMRSPSGKLTVNGAVRTESGTYRAYGQNLEISRGVIAFSGPLDDPRLDIVAERPNLDIRAGVAISGTALSPRVRLFSEPEMSDTDKLSWLMLGRAPEGLGRADTSLLQRAALALWAGEENDAPSDALLKTIGLDELTLRQTESGDVRETVVRVGKQIGRRWYVGYERSVNGTTGTWQVVYRLAQRLTVRAQSGSDNSLDAIWTWRWD
jgi:translocation and assembly module TamB